MRNDRLYTVEGIILKRKSTGEADRILTVFSRQRGKIRVLAKGVRKTSSRRAGHLEVFTQVVLTLHSHASLDIVTEASSVKGGAFFGTGTTRIGFAYCMCELVDQLLYDRQEHEDVYYLLRDGLNDLLTGEKISDWRTTLARFVHGLLRILGFLDEQKQIHTDAMRSYIEQITERRLKAWQPLTA